MSELEGLPSGKAVHSAGLAFLAPGDNPTVRALQAAYAIDFAPLLERINVLELGLAGDLKIINERDSLKAEVAALKQQLTETKEQLRLCNIDQCNTEAEVESLKQQVADCHKARRERGDHLDRLITEYDNLKAQLEEARKLLSDCQLVVLADMRTRIYRFLTRTASAVPEKEPEGA